MNFKEASHVQTPTQQDLMCVKCKSFFGNQAFGRMCSQCYKKHGASETQKQESPVISSGNIVTPVKEPKQPVKEQIVEKKEVNKDRCSTCSRKLRLLGVQCRCGLFFCNSHRLPEDHKCTFNHKDLGKERLAKQVVKVQNGKIEGI